MKVYKPVYDRGWKIVDKKIDQLREEVKEMIGDM